MFEAVGYAVNLQTQTASILRNTSLAHPMIEVHSEQAICLKHEHTHCRVAVEASSTCLRGQAG
jgi:hypothetical protein